MKKLCLYFSAMIHIVPTFFAIFIFFSLTIVFSCKGQNDTTSQIGSDVPKMEKDIMIIFQDSKGNFWFGSRENGVYRYDGKTLTQFTTKEGLCFDRIRGIQEDGDGNGTGDACEPDACPCFGSPGVPGDLADAINDAAEWRQSHPPADDFTTTCITEPTGSAYTAAQAGVPVPDAWAMGVNYNFQQGVGVCTIRRIDDHTLPNTFAAQLILVNAVEAGQCVAAAKAIQSDDPLDICTSP